MEESTECLVGNCQSVLLRMGRTKSGVRDDRIDSGELYLRVTGRKIQREQTQIVYIDYAYANLQSQRTVYIQIYELCIWNRRD